MLQFFLRFFILAWVAILQISFVEAYTANSGVSNCPGNTTDTNGQKQILVTTNTTSPRSGTLDCETHGYYGGSWSSWLNVGINPSGSHYICPDDRYASRIEYRAWDTQYRVFCKFIDDTPPTLADVTNNVPENLLANSSYSYELNISENGGSPIDFVRYRRENTANDSLSWNLIDTTAPWISSWDIRNVDNYKLPNGSRQYTYILNRVCDEAGNCWNGDERYNHNVYPNSVNIVASTLSNELDTPIVADGTVKNIAFSLRDIYGNAITAASGIGRTVDLNISVDNDLREDQYTNIGINSAFYVDNTSTRIPIWSNIWFSRNNRSSLTWDYTLPFYVYAPTQNTDPFVLWNARINNINYDINASIDIETGDKPQWVILPNTNTTITASPLFASSISGDITRQGFLEWVVQNLDIWVSRVAGNTTPVNATSLRAEFWDVAWWANIANSRYNFAVNGNSIANGPQLSWVNTTQLSPNLWDLNNNDTFLSQQSAVSNQSFSYFATIIKYIVWGKTIVYPSDIFWKDSYIGDAWENNSYQEGIRVVWNTSSKSNVELIEDQFTDDLRILWQLTKSTLRKDIEQKVFQVTRNITTNTISWNVTQLWDISARPGEWENTDGEKLFWNKVLLFRNPGWWRVNISGDTIEWQKTLVVENGDVYIQGNITNSTADDLLGIIVLNGDILIDTRVTDIHAILYTNRSVYSSTNGTNRLDGTVTASDLANQLYIKWSIFSENTTWWSRAATPECPYYISASDCTTIQQAQAYDLNYLRRYFIYDSDVPADGIPDTPSWAQSDADGQSWFENFPVVIDYNPLIQQSPPPFFE